MNLVVKRMRCLGVIALALGVIACSSKPDISPPKMPVVDKISLDVYKNPTCTYCGKWAADAWDVGFQTVAYQPIDAIGSAVPDMSIVNPDRKTGNRYVGK